MYLPEIKINKHNEEILHGSVWEWNFKRDYVVITGLNPNEYENGKTKVKFDNIDSGFVKSQFNIDSGVEKKNFWEVVKERKQRRLTKNA